MNANNYTNWNLVKYASVLSSLILMNYFLWAINSFQFLKFINFIFLFSAFLFFFISKKFNEFWHLKIIMFLLMMISLGTPTIPIDSRNLFLFSAKILFYESNLYILLDSYNHNINQYLEIVFAKPKLAVTLSATFAQLIGFWNEIFPKY